MFAMALIWQTHPINSGATGDNVKITYLIGGLLEHDMEPPLPSIDLHALLHLLQLLELPASLQDVFVGIIIAIIFLEALIAFLHHDLALGDPGHCKMTVY